MRFFESEVAESQMVNTIRCMVVARPESSGLANTIMSKLGKSPFWFYTVSSNTFSADNITVLSDSFFNVEDPSFSFDADDFSKFITKQYDYDVVFSFDIGFGSLLSNLFFNRTSHKPSLIGFHSKDQISDYDLVGLTYFDLVAIPDQKTKSLLIEQCKKLFNEKTIERIEKKFILFVDFNSDSVYQLIEKQRRISDRSEAIDKIKEKIRIEGSTSKEALIRFLNWGRGIPWTPYRRAILDDPNFYDAQHSVPQYIYKEDE